MKMLKNANETAVRVIACVAVLFAAPLSAQACSTEPYMGSICIMAWPKNVAFGGNLYMAASGQTLQVNQYQALYSLIGNTYGGSMPSTFQLPDFRGRTIVGVGQGPGLPAFNYGAKGGVVEVTLSIANLPAHAHAVSTLPVTVPLNTGVATSTLTGLSATTSMAGVTATVSGSSFALNAYNGNGGGSSAAGAALASANGPAAKIYASSAPNVAMIAGSISGSANVAFSGTPTTTFSGGQVQTTLSGNLTGTVGGNTNSTGSGVAFGILPPYITMPIYIAVGGIYPTSD